MFVESFYYFFFFRYFLFLGIGYFLNIVVKFSVDKIFVVYMVKLECIGGEFKFFKLDLLFIVLERSRLLVLIRNCF